MKILKRRNFSQTDFNRVLSSQKWVDTSLNKTTNQKMKRIYLDIIGGFSVTNDFPKMKIADRAKDK